MTMWLTMRELGIILFIFALNHNIQAQTTKSAACSLTADVGTGSESEVRAYMYYDAEKDNCYPFRYFGSGGNANRFITERQCMRNCSNRADELFPKDERQACYLPKKPGECVGHYLRYYYSPEHHTCKSFYWTGCVGNGNRFLTLSWCNATCYNAADEGLEDYSGESDVPVGIILGVVFGLIGAVILIVVIVFAVKKKPSSKKHGKKDGKSAEQPLKEQAIEMGGGEAQPDTLEVSSIQS
ncbi:kunitz-type serine protease inhibitor bitisilin-3-like [Sinocyclocheilus anshuiensis]|uniref:kunitz-type serine protease inhibitor bitisilin-3-like n=1 Tax=Sinocyclocheilus anshuiensis TaxID=1608454 RepID=UPI0007B923F5|nr:PREDICTED: kunitz-type serine protease inhibitor bitisilin-3-like [Sinocyclocheilus anshuiensis]